MMTSKKFTDTSVGEQLPAVAVPLTRTIIMAGAIASRDYQEIHHDPDIARERGTNDVIMNILTTNGYVGRFVTDWCGPNGIIRSVKIRLGTQNYPGDTMTLTGEVTELRPDTRTAVVVVRGANSLGDHVTGTVEVTLP